MAPCSPCDIEIGTADASIYRGNIEYLQTQMGYRFRVTKATKVETAKAGDTVDITLSIANEGIAPAYSDYRIGVAVVPAYNVNKPVGSGVVKFEATKLMPGREVDITVPVKINKKAEGKYVVVVYVMNKSGKAKVMNLAMTDKLDDKVYSLYQIEITK